MSDTWTTFDLAAQEDGKQKADQELANRQTQLTHVQLQLKIVSKNMSLAKTSEQFETISGNFDQLKAQEASLQTEIEAAKSEVVEVVNIDKETAGAMAIVHHLTDLATEAKDLKLAREALNLTNARLFLQFYKVQVKKRKLNKVAGGIVVFGTAPNPIETYQGPTDRRSIKNKSSQPQTATKSGKPSLPKTPRNSVVTSTEGNSLRNVNDG